MLKVLKDHVLPDNMEKVCSQYSQLLQLYQTQEKRRGEKGGEGEERGREREGRREGRKEREGRGEGRGSYIALFFIHKTHNIGIALLWNSIAFKNVLLLSTKCVNSIF